jgi:hypothetical protein
MNVVMYANRGTVTLILTDKDIMLEVKDEGPGIPDIELAMQEGYSTASDEMRERPPLRVEQAFHPSPAFALSPDATVEEAACRRLAAQTMEEVRPLTGCYRKRYA